MEARAVLSLPKAERDRETKETESLAHQPSQWELAADPQRGRDELTGGEETFLWPLSPTPLTDWP